MKCVVDWIGFVSLMAGVVLIGACDAGDSIPAPRPDAALPDAALPDADPCIDVDCSAMTDMCNTGTCNPMTGACEPVAMVDGTMCDDGSVCTTGDVCTGGSCGGMAMDCSAMDDMCHVGTCNEVTAECESIAVMDGTTCDDAAACTSSDVCTEGTCAGTAVDCSGMTDMCNVGMCNMADGMCGATPVADDTACDDGDAGTFGDVCTAGMCSGRPWAGIRTFTSCGETAHVGPSQMQCDTAYMTGTLDAEVTVRAGRQRWTVPVTGTYRIEAFGGQGFSATSGYSGGNGARMRGDFMLTMGQRVDILVGQAAITTSICNGGGGGGSFVVDVATGEPLLVAGGGGGLRQDASHNGCPGRVSTRGGGGSSGVRSSDCVADSSSAMDRAGGIVSSRSWGSGGGGFSGDGAGEGS